MDPINKTFLEILKAALAGEQAVPTEELMPEQWQKLFHMAAIHSVLPLVFDAVYRLPALRQANLPFLPAVKRQAMQEVMLQTMRTSEFLKLNERLRAAGVTPLVVKGMICRNLYPNPDCRPSGDEDILILPEQFETCHRVMLDFGMHTAEEPDRLLTAYEVPYRKAGSPLYVELHKHLFPPESNAYGDLNRFFEGVFDRAAAERIQGSTVYTMGCTDHLFYLICHAFKHFLHSGFGIRQVCDVILYANRYGSRIDWTQLLENCRQIHADRFAAAMFRIGSHYFVFDADAAAYPEAWRSIEADELPMLEDLLRAGIYGSADMSRKHSSSITLDAVTARKQGKKAKNAVLASVFPPLSELQGRYPYLKKHPWLLPAAWCSRIWQYSREDHSGNNRAAESLKIGSERIELMRKYGIIE